MNLKFNLNLGVRYLFTWLNSTHTFFSRFFNPRVDILFIINAQTSQTLWSSIRTSPSYSKIKSYCLKYLRLFENIENYNLESDEKVRQSANKTNKVSIEAWYLNKDTLKIFRAFNDGRLNIKKMKRCQIRKR